jgi:hypothetical protein
MCLMISVEAESPPSKPPAPQHHSRGPLIAQHSFECPLTWCRAVLVEVAGVEPASEKQSHTFIQL